MIRWREQCRRGWTSVRRTGDETDADHLDYIRYIRYDRRTGDETEADHLNCGLRREKPREEDVRESKPVGKVGPATGGGRNARVASKGEAQTAPVQTPASEDRLGIGYNVQRHNASAHGLYVAAKTVRFIESGMIDGEGDARNDDHCHDEDVERRCRHREYQLVER